MLRVAVIIDYQNIHLTAHDKFCPSGRPRHESLIHLLHFAHQVVQARADARRKAGIHDGVAAGLSLSRVAVFRGLPSNRYQPDFYRRNLAQRSEWTRDARVAVDYRPLKYYVVRDGSYTAQEKGVDVRVALEVVRATDSGLYDVVILASHDTDLEPAIEYALDSDPARTGTLHIETAGWAGCKRLRSRRDRPGTRS